MGTAALVATAFGLALLVLTAYVLIEGSMVTATTLANAQSELAQLQEARLRTSIAIRNTSGLDPLYVEVENTGSEMLGDLGSIDVFIVNTNAPIRCAKGSGAYTWEIVSILPDTIHPNQLDPGETLNLSISTGGSAVIWVQVTTANGISASRYVG